MQSYTLDEQGQRGASPFLPVFRPGPLAPGLTFNVAIDLPCHEALLGQLDAVLEVRLRSVVAM